MSKEPNQSETMENYDNWQDDSKDIKFKLQSGESNPLLDDFLGNWRDELYRKNCILRLNDDCFYKIFSFLPLIDLCAVNETCHDFRRLAGYCFSVRNKSLYLCEDSLKNSKRLIRNFGQFIMKLSIEPHHLNQHEDKSRLLPVLDRYCIILQDLTLNNVDLRPNIISQSTRLISNLHRLRIKQLKNQTIVPIDDILIHCASLKQLELIKIELFVLARASLQMPVKSLESLSLVYCLLHSSEKLNNFFLLNCQLKQVKFINCWKTNTFDDNRDDPTLLNLESLHILASCIQPTSIIENIASMPLGIKDINVNSSRLNELEIDSTSFQSVSCLCSLLSRLAVDSSITDLHIELIELNLNRIRFNDPTATFDDELLNNLCALRTLKLLRLTGAIRLDVDKSKRLACELSDLSGIEFSYCEVEFTTIETFVEYSKNVKRIVFDSIAKEPQPLTKSVLMSLVEARNRNKYNTDTVTLFLTPPKKQTRWHNDDEISKLIKKYANVINVIAYSNAMRYY